MNDPKTRKQINQWPDWPTARDWIGMGTFALTVMLLWMMKGDHTLMKDDFFKTIATLIIGTGFVNGAVSWAYSATQGGTELASRNAALVEQQAQVPKTVEIDQPDNKAIPVKPADDEGDKP